VIFGDWEVKIAVSAIPDIVLPAKSDVCLEVGTWTQDYCDNPSRKNERSDLFGLRACPHSFGFRFESMPNSMLLTAHRVTLRSITINSIQAWMSSPMIRHLS
jgi:hypothetical protein